MIDQREATEAVSAFEAVLHEIGYSWIVEFVEGQEKELGALSLGGRERQGSRTRQDKPPSPSKQSASDLGLMDLVRPELRKLTLLLLTVYAYCVSPFYWIREAESTLARVDVTATNLSELGSGFWEETVATRLENALEALATFVLEHGEDPAAAELIRYWVSVGGAGSDATQTS